MWKGKPAQPFTEPCSWSCDSQVHNNKVKSTQTQKSQQMYPPDLPPRRREKGGLRAKISHGPLQS